MKQVRITWEEQTMDELLRIHGSELLQRIKDLNFEAINEKYAQDFLKEYELLIRFTFWLRQNHYDIYKVRFDEFIKQLPKGASDVK